MSEHDKRWLNRVLRLLDRLHEAGTIGLDEKTDLRAEAIEAAAAPEPQQPEPQPEPEPPVAPVSPAGGKASGKGDKPWLDRAIPKPETS